MTCNLKQRQFIRCCKQKHTYLHKQHSFMSAEFLGCPVLSSETLAKKDSEIKKRWLWDSHFLWVYFFSSGGDVWALCGSRLKRDCGTTTDNSVLCTCRTSEYLWAMTGNKTIKNLNSCRQHHDGGGAPTRDATACVRRVLGLVLAGRLGGIHLPDLSKIT